MLSGLRSTVFPYHTHKPRRRSFILLLRLLWTLWFCHAQCEMHHPLLGMPADILKSTDDLVYGICWVQILRSKKDGDCTFFQNTMRILHNPLGARKAQFFQTFLFAKEIVYARVGLRSRNFSARFYGSWERGLALRIMGKCTSNHLLSINVYSPLNRLWCTL